MIGRGGSSLANKNILPVHGHPLLHWGAAAARRSRHINDYYISSDDDAILKTAAKMGYNEIRRPDDLASATAQSCDAVRHALDIIEADGIPVDVLVIQHANVGTISETMIDDCIDILLANPDLTAVVPSHENQEYHPMRSKRVMDDGTLQPFVPGPASANRQELPQAVFFDHSFWVVRGRTAVCHPEGQGPWPCMGNRIRPYLTQGCLDVHHLEDLKKTEQWITDNSIPSPSV
ncbi:Acylneuraminate cytidylyltransferase [Sphingobium herbicidovorans NBRC 16415]|uniref:Acylneuraminate cytidylyltransferase n=1 Tax=Sphingobium herbicidovorans (strain ATCC 700291 / DSM 11019 / CCUG 56400 / KCTC 2939 / LMG 18315 / NBRC 16415 / MH) TaxID=1219045 RepID=A0A086PED1_SPHHM|nr:hypothetical protein [Sphingobium herbicidovorans]KFG91749.1 Acylneuraminate cytidylyltransferase [Sphingobium herbicidovorans NBRC 16415]